MVTALESLNRQIEAARARYLRAVWCGSLVAAQVETDRLNQLIHARVALRRTLASQQ